MTTQNFFILTAEQAHTATELDSDSYRIEPRPADNETPGVGINLNDKAADYAPGEPVSLEGASVLAKRIMDDPNQTQALKDFLGARPFATLETETIFAPVSSDG